MAKITIQAELLFDGLELKRVLSEAGGTNVIELKLDGETHQTAGPSPLTWLHSTSARLAVAFSGR